MKLILSLTVHSPVGAHKHIGIPALTHIIENRSLVIFQANTY